MSWPDAMFGSVVVLAAAWFFVSLLGHMFEGL